MNGVKTGSLFQFEHKDTCVKECRPLVDPLPHSAGTSLHSSRTTSPTMATGTSEYSWNNLNPSTDSSFSLKRTNKDKEKPAGSPSFARRPIPNGHFQRGQEFKPSIRIHHPPGGVDRIGL